MSRSRWFAGGLLLAAVVSGIVLYRGNSDAEITDLTVGWGGGEGHPCCVYDPGDRSVDVELTVDGTALGDASVTVTGTAYADENTSDAVGSASRTVHLDGTVHTTVTVTVPVDREPHVDEDGVVACRLSVDY